MFDSVNTAFGQRMIMLHQINLALQVGPQDFSDSLMLSCAPAGPTLTTGTILARGDTHLWPQSEC